MNLTVFELGQGVHRYSNNNDDDNTNNELADTADGTGWCAYLLMNGHRRRRRVGHSCWAWTGDKLTLSVVQRHDVCDLHVAVAAADVPR